MASRVKNSMRNVSISILSYIVTLLLQIVSRTIFVSVLSKEYLGLSGLFSNILAMLSLSELGIGTALVYSLYKPVAENREDEIKNLMALYAKIYRAIGGFILVVGTILTPFLKYLIKDMPQDMPLIYVYFWLSVLDCGISYFYTYKRSLIICYQEEYISSLTTTVKNIASRILQIIILLLTHSYLLYLVVQIVCTRAENVAISKIADKKYPYLKDKNVEPVSKEQLDTIKKNTMALMCHKIGSVVVNATDNIIMSKILGLGIVGLISNYLLIIDSISSFTTKIMNSLIASVGNLVVDTEMEKTEKVFYRILFMNFSMYSFCFVGLTVNIQNFIQLWLGDNYIVSYHTVIVFAMYFYLAGVRKTVLVFRDAVGLFWNDRYKAIVEAIVNVGVSIPLTYYFGATGVRLGSIISCLSVAFWIEAYVLFKHYFEHGLIKYLLIQLGYFVLTIGITFIDLRGVMICQIDGWFGFVCKVLICIGIYVLLYLIVFWKNVNFIYFKNILLKKKSG